MLLARFLGNYHVVLYFTLSFCRMSPQDARDCFGHRSFALQCLHDSCCFMKTLALATPRKLGPRCVAHESGLEEK